MFYFKVAFYFVCIDIYNTFTKKSFFVDKCKCFIGRLSSSMDTFRSLHRKKIIGHSVWLVVLSHLKLRVKTFSLIE